MQIPSSHNPLKLGTRTSPLAMAQAFEVRQRLCALHDWPENFVQIKSMKTSGDRFTDRPLSAIGGKGLFTKELELGLYEQQIDFAVHSMKDVATVLPDGLALCAILPRENVADAFVSLKYDMLDEMPENAKIGTSSLRRKAQVLRSRPDLSVVEFRGTVETRLKKLEAGVADATFLAMAGLIRLGRHDLFESGVAKRMSIDDMLPAAAQGAIGIEVREDDRVCEYLAPLNCEISAKAVQIERAFLRVLDGSCRTPIAAHFDGYQLKGQVLSLDGARVLDGNWTQNQSSQLGEWGAKELIDRGAAEILG